MKPLHLPTDPLGAAIRARPVTPAAIVWVHRPKRGVWCALHRATGGRNIFLCRDWSPGNEPVHILTGAPHNSCPACETELAAGTPGAVAVSRTTTAELPRLSASAEQWDAWHGEPDEGTAFDILDDLRPEEP
jgi:hypothetical protein